MKRLMVDMTTLREPNTLRDDILPREYLVDLLGVLLMKSREKGENIAKSNGVEKYLEKEQKGLYHNSLLGDAL